MTQADHQSLPDKKVDAGDPGLVRLLLDTETDRGVDSGDGTPPSATAYVNGRDYTITDNPGGTPVPEHLEKDITAQIEGQGFKIKKLGKADPESEPLPGEIA